MGTELLLKQFKDAKKNTGKRFYAKLQQLCANKGVSISTMVSDIGLTSGIITWWKNGSIPRNKTLKKIADYFGIKMQDLTMAITMGIDLPHIKEPEVAASGLYPVLKAKPMSEWKTPKFEYNEISFEYGKFESQEEMAEFFRDYLESRDKIIIQLEDENCDLRERIGELKEMLRIQNERITELKADKKTVGSIDSVVHR
jgi:transcriptional regulator with XRE-family HTH domain